MRGFFFLFRLQVTVLPGRRQLIQMAAAVLFLSFIEDGLTTAAPLLGIIDFGVHSTLNIVDNGLTVVSKESIPLFPS